LPAPSSRSSGTRRPAAQSLEYADRNRQVGGDGRLQPAESAGRHTDDRQRDAVHTQCLADGRWIGAEVTPPEGIGQDHDARRVETGGTIAPVDQASDLRATTTSALTFDRVYDTSQPPGASQAQIMASVTQLFYDVNFFHDWFYDPGFDEVSGNSQASNYGRGGLGQREKVH